VKQRGEVWLVRLDPVEGSEQGKTRPCLIVSPPESTPYRISMIVPLTSRSRATPFRPPLYFFREGRALVDQVRTVAHTRFIRRMGCVDDAALRDILAVLREMFED
jgi:mRNA interferase MazF